MSTSSSRRPATVADWLAAPDEEGLELVDGELVARASPGLAHALAQGGTLAALRPPFGRPPSGARFPGGWWIGPEVDLVLDGRGLRPDLVGWRREPMPEPPKDRPVVVRPDWICEVISESNRAHDTVDKLAWYHHAGVPHYWILDQPERTLTVHRHMPDGYLIVLRAAAGATVRAEPFDAIELEVAALLGDDPPPG